MGATIEWLETEISCRIFLNVNRRIEGAPSLGAISTQG